MHSTLLSGQREQMMTTTSNEPPNDDEKGGNVGKLWAHATVFFAIKLKTLIEMSVWCLCAFISVVMINKYLKIFSSTFKLQT